MDMLPMAFKKSGRIPNFNSKNGKKNFLVLNILLITGSFFIVSALVYLLLNLERTDAIILKALPFILSGLVLILFYAIGYHKLKEKENK
jgi:biotin transporter BioY